MSYFYSLNTFFHRPESLAYNKKVIAQLELIIDPIVFQLQQFGG